LGVSGSISRIAPLDSLTKDAKGAQVSGISFVPQTADDTYPGLISTGAQTIAGVKTFSSSPVVPTASANDNSTNAASTAYVDGAIASGKGFQGSLIVINDADYSISSGVETVIYNATLTADRALTFPSATGNTNRHIRVYLKGAGGHQLNVSSSSNFVLASTSSATSFATNLDGETMDFQSDGTTWYLTGYPHQN
jgi:hypothetical protein